MASFLSNLVSKPVVSFCLGAATVISYSHFFKASKDECIIEVDGYTDIVCDVTAKMLTSLADAFNHPHDPAITKKLASELNSMDSRLKVKSRWDAMEDDKALYLIRDMSGLVKKDVRESVEFPNGDTRVFDYRMNVFGKLCVYRIKQYQSAVLVIKYVGLQPEGGDPHTAYRGYIIKIDLSGRFYKTSDVNIDVKDDVLKITIPKQRGKRRIDKPTIVKTFNFFWPDKN